MMTKQPVAEEIKEVKESVRPGRNKKRSFFKTGDRIPKTQTKQRNKEAAMCVSVSVSVSVKRPVCMIITLYSLCPFFDLTHLPLFHTCGG